MGDTSTTVTVKILEKDYEVGCAADEVEALEACARHVDRHMQSIRNTGKVIGLDRVAVMAALNIANEYLSTESQRKQTEQRIDQLAEKLGQVIEERPSSEPVSKAREPNPLPIAETAHE